MDPDVSAVVPVDRIKSALIIGAYDAIGHDSVVPALLAANVPCVMVEPVPSAFERLQKNAPGHKLINAAIYSHTGQLTMLIANPAYSEEYEPPLWDMWQGSSSVKDNVRNNLQKELKPKGQILEVSVPCYTFDDFRKQIPNLKFDYLQIDTEGSDWIIFKQINLDRHGVKVVNIETMWLTPEERRQAARKVRGWNAVREDGVVLRARRM